LNIKRNSRPTELPAHGKETVDQGNKENEKHQLVKALRNRVKKLKFITKK